MPLSTWSTSPSSNSTVNGVNIAEGCPAGNLNNAIRGLMADLASSIAAAIVPVLAGTAPLPIANGGTGAIDSADALTALGGVSVSAMATAISTAISTALSSASFLTAASFTSSLNANGWAKLPGGLTIQWGSVAVSNGNFNFPTAFANSCLAFFATNSNSQGSFVDNAYGNAVSASQFFVATKSSTSSGVFNYPVAWFAVGF